MFLRKLPLAVLACAPISPLTAQSRTVADASAPPSVVTITAGDYYFAVPGPVRAGPVTLRLVNHGRELHMMGVATLGKWTLAQLVEAFQAGKQLDGVAGIGGPNGVAPGDTSVATLMLAPGHYAIACFVESPDGTMHVAKGMLGQLDVVATPGPAVPEPVADAAIELRDYAIALSGPVAPGRRTFRVENHGPNTHDVQLFRLAPRASMADVDAWLTHPESGSPRARPLGGVVGFAPGKHSWFTAQMTPGDYLLVCWIPGEGGKPHYAGHGMLRRFHVGSSVAATGK